MCSCVHTGAVPQYVSPHGYPMILVLRYLCSESFGSRRSLPHRKFACVTRAILHIIGRVVFVAISKTAELCVAAVPGLEP